MASLFPFALFKADDWRLPTSSLGLDQGIWLKLSKGYHKDVSSEKNRGKDWGTDLLKGLAQLSFTCNPNTHTIACC